MIDLTDISERHVREALAGCFSDDNPFRMWVMDGVEVSISNAGNGKFSEQYTAFQRWQNLIDLIEKSEMIDILTRYA